MVRKATSAAWPLDVAAWASNVSTSVLIVFVNKSLLAKDSGHGFQFATTMTALHYLACALSIGGAQLMSSRSLFKLPLADLMIFTVTANLSIASLNLSLMLNNVGFYQIAKLLIIPFVCLVEKLWLKRTFTSFSIFSIGLVVSGVSIVTVTDLSSGGSILGVGIAALSVASSGMQQVFVRTMQQRHGLSAPELLANTAPVQGLSLLAVGPLLDRYVSGSWVGDYPWTGPAAIVMLLSCACAILVNLSQFACLGRFSAVSFQVLGHMKTVCVLLGGWLFMGDRITSKQLLGMGLAVSGMMLYGLSTLPKSERRKAGQGTTTKTK